MDKMVIGESGYLHEGMDYGRSDEPESSPEEIFANSLRLGCLGRDFPT